MHIKQYLMMLHYENTCMIIPRDNLIQDMINYKSQG